MGNQRSRMDISEGRNIVSIHTTGVEDSDIAQLLQYLIRSGQVHIIAPDRDDSSDDDSLASPPNFPKTIAKPDTSALNNSDFKYLTCAAVGLMHKTGQKRPLSIASLVRGREIGLPGSGHLTTGDQCRIQNYFIPNKSDQIADYHSKIFCCSYSANGNKLLTACQDQKIRLHDTSTEGFKTIKTIQARNVGWSILDTTISPNEDFIGYTSWSESIHLVNLRGNHERHDSLVLRPFDRRFCVFCLKFSADSTEAFCGTNDSSIYIYDMEHNIKSLRFRAHDDDVNTIALADNSSQIIYSGGDDGLIKVWDRRIVDEAHPEPVGMLGGHMDGITYIEPRGDGRHFLSNSKDQSIKLWDVRCFSSNETVESSKKHTCEQGWDYRWQTIPKTLKNPLKRVSGDTSLMTYCGHSVLQTLCRCYFSPAAVTGQRFIYTGCSTGRIIIYDALTGRIVRELHGHRGTVRDLAWHPLRQEIISSSWDGTMFRWVYSDLEADRARGDEKRAGRSGQVRRSQRIKERTERLRAARLSENSDEDIRLA